jgi:hypothetical protein
MIYRIGVRVMKSKIKYIILIGMLFVQTGCMKAKVDMTINKDKSVNLAYEIGMSKAFLNSSTSDTYSVDSDGFTLSDEEIAEAKEKGYEVSNYDDGTYIGSKMSKTFKNIDNISSTEDITGSLSDLTSTESETEDVKLFIVKKGFFKNTYSAKIDISQTNDVKDLIESNYGADDASSSTNSTTSNSTTTNGTTSNSLNTTTTADTVDYEALMSSMGMDLSFNINLPYKALESNATTVSDDGKTLSWNLLTFSDNIEFTFELYNMTNIYITLGIGIILVVVIIILIITLLRKNKNKRLSDDSMSINRGSKEEYPSVTNMINQVPTEPIMQNQTQVQHSIPVTAKPILQPNPLEPSPQPINMSNQNSNSLNQNISENNNGLNQIPQNVNSSIYNQSQTQQNVGSQIPTSSSQEIGFKVPNPVQSVNQATNQNVAPQPQTQPNISSTIPNVGINQGQVPNINNNSTNLNNSTVNQSQNNISENPVDIFGANNF